MTTPLFRIVLIEPEIPQNTGNIGRTCVSTMSELHLVGKLGFNIDDTQVKRAGLDYWPYLTLHRHESFAQWFQVVQDPSRVFFFTTKTQKKYYHQEFQPGDWLVFGKETKGLAPEILQKFPNQNLTIPMIGPVRSLNLATAVAISIYEGMRQLDQPPVL